MIDIYMIFGPPASGKSSLISHFDENKTISTGNILRAMGLARKDGTLVDDRVVNKILIENLYSRFNADFIILDGYPRREEQAKFLKYLEKTGIIRLKVFLELVCSDENVIDRSCNRLVCGCGASYHPTLKPAKIENECDKCQGKLQKREDDTAETIKQRLNIYRSQCDAIRPYFENIKHLVDVNDSPMESLKQAMEIIKYNRLFHSYSRKIGDSTPFTKCVCRDDASVRMITNLSEKLNSRA